ncbi:hypothetical protein [Planobispora rosea]|uniref:hypothetical protein n=1 Tax=Planobispora rosea TaxID=35762 RepID=UPI00083A7350|nr:hypothetical protein [Planobispora rosea]
MLGLPGDAAGEALTSASREPSSALSRFRLAPGDPVVFTGEMDESREVGEARARRADYVPHSNVTKKVRLLAAANPDTLSGKTRAYGISIVTPEAFGRMLG